MGRLVVPLTLFERCKHNRHRAADGQQGPDGVVEAYSHPAPYGNPDTAGLRCSYRFPYDRTVADPNGRRGRVPELDPADDPLLLSPEARRRSAQSGYGRETGCYSDPPPHHIAAWPSKRADERMAALETEGSGEFCQMTTVSGGTRLTVT